MSKLNIIDKMRYKLLGDIKNKKWMKNYEHKNYISDLAILTSFFAFIVSVISSVVIAKNIQALIEMPSFSLGILMSFGVLFVLTPLSVALTYSMTNKIKSFFVKRNIDRFLKKAENLESEEMLKLMNKSKRFEYSEILVNRILNQTLEKEDLEDFKNTLNNNFEDEEIKDLLNDEKLKDLIKDNADINYNYVLTLLKLIEEKCKDEDNDQKIRDIFLTKPKDRKENEKIIDRSKLENKEEIFI